MEKVVIKSKMVELNLFHLAMMGNYAAAKLGKATCQLYL